jgi:hypothetical protein
MSYSDWDDNFRDIYDEIPGIDQPDVDENYAELLYETAFTHSAAELDAMGYDISDVAAMRDEFFDYLGIDASDFDWEGWREAMGYE